MSRLMAARLAGWFLVASGAFAIHAAARIPLGSVVDAAAGPDRAPLVEATETLSDSAVSLAVGAHPFRADRRPAPRQYDAVEPSAGPVELVPPPLRPPLRLAGLLWGETPRAVLEGVPGRESGVVLAAGDTAGGLRVRRLERGRVVVQGHDTTWVLTPRGLW